MLTNFIFILLIGLSAYLWREKYHLTRQLVDCDNGENQREYGQRYKEIFENTSDAIFVVEIENSGNLNLGSYNPAVVQMLGLDIEAAKGRTLDEILNQTEDTNHRRVLRELSTRITETIYSGMSVKYEIEIPSASKAYPVSYEFNIVPMADDAGISHIFCFAKNISATKLHEQELQERVQLEKKLSSFAVSAPGFFFSFQHGADGNNAMPFASRGIYDLFGLHPDDVAENISPLTLLIHRDDLKLFFDAIALSAVKKVSFDIEFRAQHPGKGELWIELRCTPVEMPDNSVLWHGFMHNVTDRKLLELCLNDTKEKLRELVIKNEAKHENERKRIAWEMHEELGQLLAAMKMRVYGMRAQLLKEAPSLSEENRIINGLIDKSIKTIRELVSDLRPSILQHGLDMALEWLVVEFKARTGLQCNLDIREDDTLINDELSTLVFRVVQEFLENIERHTGVSWIAITWLNSPSQTMLAISHDGLAPDDYSLSLFGIQERVMSVGGEMQMYTNFDHSFETEMKFPVRLETEVQP